MILPDVNVLLGAFRTQGPLHPQCRGWLNSVVAGDEPFGIAPRVLNAVVRIATNRRIYEAPDTVADALEFCNGLLRQPHCRVILPGIGHWEIFCDLCREVDARGNLVTDAWFAALAIESGCEWITLDRDFARFRRLRWRAPF